MSSLLTGSLLPWLVGLAVTLFGAAQTHLETHTLLDQLGAPTWNERQKAVRRLSRPRPDPSILDQCLWQHDLRWAIRGPDLQRRRHAERLRDLHERRSVQRVLGARPPPVLDGLWVDGSGYCRCYYGTIYTPSWRNWQVYLIGREWPMGYYHQAMRELEQQNESTAASYPAWQLATRLWVEDCLGWGVPAPWMRVVVNELARRERLWDEQCRRNLSPLTQPPED